MHKDVEKDIGIDTDTDEHIYTYLYIYIYIHAHVHISTNRHRRRRIHTHIYIYLILKDLGHLSIPVRASQCVPSPPLLATAFQAQEVLKANGSLMMNAFLHSADVRAPHHRQGGGSRCIWLCNCVVFGSGLCLSKRYTRLDEDWLCLKAVKWPWWVSYFERTFARVEMCWCIYSGSVWHLSCYCFVLPPRWTTHRGPGKWQKSWRICVSRAAFLYHCFSLLGAVGGRGWVSGGVTGAEVVQMYYSSVRP